MKKIFVWISLGINVFFINAQDKDDPVIMTIAGKDIPLSEFIFLAQKDSSVNLLDKKSLANWVELFKNFKLKVADAEALHLHETMAFNDELDSYKAQLRASYLSDKAGEAAVVRKVYDRGKDMISISHIIFPLGKQYVSKDTVPVYNEIYKVYQRIKNGEDFTTVGQELAADSTAFYEEVDYVHPLQAMKSLEDAAYALEKPGDISAPVRTDMGFHLIRLDDRIPNPGKIKVAHILIAPEDNSLDPSADEDAALLKKATEIYERAVKGENFGQMAKIYSADTNTGGNNGELPYFGLGEMVKTFEDAAFALKDTGDISKPVKTRYGYHIIKLLNKRPRASYEEMEPEIFSTLKKGEWNFELYNAFDEREKTKFGYVFYPEAYAELQKLCDDYHPSDTAYYDRAILLDKPLMMLNDTIFPQNEFAEYLHRYPFSTKHYSGDFLYDIYRLFVRTIVTELEKRSLNDNHPEFDKLVKEYYDGILLFDISSKRVWDKPVEQQAQLEADWIKELKQKYDVKINNKVLKNIKKYIANK